ncbi:hypothetical protein Tco_1114627 [Tanacetum coccineum]|uniref:Uncharacterized protein n=1 Tax=Tanacetum coccineum TaxID=301880 RepID=A0ABQ5IZB0_9ASTR
MSLPTIYISFDTIGESIGSSAYVILSDSEPEVVFVPAILPEVALEAEVALVTSPTDVLDLVRSLTRRLSRLRLRYHRTMPFKAESEESSKDDASEAAQPLPAQIVSAPLAPGYRAPQPTEPHLLPVYMLLWHMIQSASKTKSALSHYDCH